MDRERDQVKKKKERCWVYKSLWRLSSYPEQRDVHLAQAVGNGGVHIVLSLEVKEQPSHSVHGDVGHHSEGIPTQRGI